jgi:hypothetical protein
MKLGIFAKTFNRPTIEELFQSIAGYGIIPYNSTCPALGSSLFRKTCHPNWLSESLTLQSRQKSNCPPSPERSTWLIRIP